VRSIILFRGFSLFGTSEIPEKTTMDYTFGMETSMIGQKDHGKNALST
jgi:hypothetical protein